MLKSRSLTGPEKLKVFHNKKVWLLLPNFPCNEASKIQHLWDELLQLNMLFSSAGDDLSPAVIDTFECRARECIWGRNFLCVYQSKDVTPYIHALMNHVGQFMQIHGSILPFTQQGLEKLNDVVTKNFFFIHHATEMKPSSSSWKSRIWLNIWMMQGKREPSCLKLNVLTVPNTGTTALPALNHVDSVTVTTL